MIKLTPQDLLALERQTPGITGIILRFDRVQLPRCPRCRSDNTAAVYTDLDGKMERIAQATTRVYLAPGSNLAGKFYCYSCADYYD